MRFSSVAGKRSSVGGERDTGEIVINVMVTWLRSGVKNCIQRLNVVMTRCIVVTLRSLFFFRTTYAVLWCLAVDFLP